MRFEDPTYLYLLLIIPVMFLLRIHMLWKRRKALRLWGDKELTLRQMPELSRHRPMAKFCLLMAALALIVVMLARPQMGTKVSNEKRNGIEAIICLDISNSMLAADVTPDRLTKSKMLVENMVDHFVNDKIGLVVFAGDAFTQLPITADYVSAKMFLQNTTPALIEEQGTDIAKAIDLARNSFTLQKNIGRAIIVITDGEDHEGGALEAAKAAKKAGMRVFILGVGSTSGAPIPNGEGGYMTDNSGNTVMTALNETMCKEVAAAGSGTYIHVDNTNEAQERLNDELSKMQKNEVSSVVYSEYDDQFQVVGIIIVLLLVLEVLIYECKPEWQKDMSLFKKKTKAAAIVMLMMLMAGNAQAQNDRQLIRQGNREFRAQQYEKAEATFRKACAANANNPEAHYNLGCALQAQQKDSMAITCYEKAAKMQPDKMRRAQAFHNMGVICQQKKMFAEAIDAYKESLRCNPKDDETRYNLALCMKQLKNQPKQNQQKNQNDNKDNKDKNKDQDKNQEKNKPDEKKQQDQQEQMSKDNAEQLLNAAMQQEQATQQRLKKAQQQPRKSRHQKNW